nr:Putative leucine-rich repeat receptor-like protein kinase family protein [Ipomoea batatas]GMC83283.1 Putative leucine-rich repeat receptor-like protein kinase family protein [Ipomoea batatas]
MVPFHYLLLSVLPIIQICKLLRFLLLHRFLQHPLLLQWATVRLGPLLEGLLRAQLYCLLLLQFCLLGGGEGNRKTISLMFPLRRTLKCILDSSRSFLCVNYKLPLTILAIKIYLVEVDLVKFTKGG